MALELVKPKSGAGKGAQEQFVLHVPSLSTNPEIIAAAIEKLPNCPTEVSLETENFCLVSLVMIPMELPFDSHETKPLLPSF